MRAILTKAITFILRGRVGIWLAVIGAMFLFGIFEFALTHWLLLQANVAPNSHCAVQAIFAAMGAGLSLWVVLTILAGQRRMLDDELRRVGELNHTLRNALEVIVLAHYSVADEEHKAMVLECTNRIDQKLRELFPAIGKTKIIIKDGRWEIKGRER